MAKTTIEWTATYNDDGTITPGYTFNPWIGCQKVSDGCKYCYAERDFTRKPRWANTWGPPETSERLRTSDANWRKPLQWNKQAEAEGIRRKVFCASLADVFEDNLVLIPWRRDLWKLIEQTPNLDWLLLTKRPHNISWMLPFDYEIPRNIWLGVSAENQDTLGERWSILDSETHYLRPKVLFLSLEPLLELIDLSGTLEEIDVGNEEHYWWTRSPDWVIVGGESGPDARPMNPRWVRNLRDDCIQANVPFFFKQWGEYLPHDHDPTSLMHGITPDFYTDPDAGYSWVKVGKKAAGRMLDGREWNEAPRLEIANG